MKKWWSRLAFLFVLTTPPSIETVFGQVLPSNLNCADSRAWIKQNFYTGRFQNLGYSVARRKMYAYIDNNNDSLECIYGGYKQYHRNGNEITSILPINCEHTIPQSFFNSVEPMVCDIHHLFPTYDDWNSVRANFPFAEIPDALTTQWMRNINSQAGIPTTFLPEWSEFNIRSSVYEPREKQKGNTARAILYFYTMYGDQMASYGNPITRVASLETLWAWHTQDPPDDAERERNRRTAIYQGNRNPYIDNPSWVSQAFIVGCSTISSVSENSKAIQRLDVAPNPTQGELNIQLEMTQTVNAQVHILNILGEKMNAQNLGTLNVGIQNVKIDLTDLREGTYILQLETTDLSGNLEGRQVLKVVKQ